jgi:mannose-6-phosphate isomerase-like protein (cupin superfamily)
MSGLVQVRRWVHSEMRHFEAFAGQLSNWLGGDVDQPECFAAFEEFRPEEPASRGVWTNWYDEVDIVVGGSALCTIWLPPTHIEARSTTLVPGDVILVPCGARVVFDAQGSDPYCHLIVQMPRPAATAEQDSASFTNT